MKRVAAALLLSSAVAAPAFAADEGFYAGVKLGQAKYNTTGLTKNNPTAFGVFGGYSINKNFAVEAEYIDLGSVATAGTVGGVAVTASAKTSAWGLSAVGTLPLNNNFSLYGKLGFARAKSDFSGTGTLGSVTVTTALSENKTAATFGLGGLYNVNQSVGIRFGWDRYKVGSTGPTNVNLYSIGAVFKF